MNVRSLTTRDADAVAAMVVAGSESLTGRPSRLGPADVREWWSRARLERDSWLFEEDERPLAAGWMHAYGDKAAFAGIVAQGAKGRGLGGAIVDRAEAAARSQGLARMHTWALPEDVAASELFRMRGYRDVRRFYEMAIELEVAPPEPDITVEPFRAEDARAFHDAIEEAFRDHWEWYGMPFPEWWELRRDDDHSLWFVVRDGDELAAAIRNEANRNGGGYVGIIGVRRAWRGRGLATALLRRTFGEFWRRGIARISLAVDAESPTGATKLYESVGMHVESATAVYER